LAMDAQDVETHYESDVWKNRRPDGEPFSSGGPRLRQVAVGAEAVRWALHDVGRQLRGPSVVPVLKAS
jgi:hypothetical protein